LSIRGVGSVWDSKLKQVEKQNISLREKARILGVDPNTVKTKLIQAESCNVIINNDLKRDGYRNEWKQLLQWHREKSITEIRSLNSKVYTWLYRKDKEWLKSHYPNVEIKRTEFKERIDWKQRDKGIFVKVELIVEEILEEKNKLLRVSKNEIGRRLGTISFLYNNLDIRQLKEKIKM